MATALHDKMKSVGSKRRKKIEARAAELVAEEMALRELRKAHHRTQTSMAKQLGISQDGVSRLEKRSDLLLSTLRNYVEAMGGNLHLIAEFPDQPPVMLSGLSDIVEDHSARGEHYPPDEKQGPQQLCSQFHPTRNKYGIDHRACYCVAFQNDSPMELLIHQSMEQNQCDLTFALCSRQFQLLHLFKAYFLSRMPQIILILHHQPTLRTTAQSLGEAQGHLW